MPDSRLSYRGHALLVGNDPQFFDTLSHALKKAHFAVTRAESAEAAVVLMAADLRPDVAVIDTGLPNMTGIQLARRLRQTRRCPSILLAERSEIEAMKKAAVSGSSACLDRSLPIARILHAMKIAIRRPAGKKTYRTPGKTGRKNYPAVPRNR